MLFLVAQPNFHNIYLYTFRSIKSIAHVLFFAGTLVSFNNSGHTGRSGVIQEYIVPHTAKYRIAVGGARGGRHITSAGSYTGTHYIVNNFKFILPANGKSTLNNCLLEICIIEILH